MSSATEEKAGGSRGDDGDMHVYRSNNGDGWARLCVVADGVSHRADAVLPPGQAAGFADEIDWAIRTGERLTCWWGASGTSELAGTPGSARVAYFSARNNRRVLEVLGQDGSTVFVLASDKALSEVSAALREVAGLSPPPANCMAAAKRRTDDNLRRVFG